MSESRPLRVAELFCGLKGWSAPAEERGHEVWTTDLDPRFSPSLAADVLDLKASDLPWRPDVVLASPPCEAFTVMLIGRNWTEPDDTPPNAPRTEAARLGLRILERTVALIQELQPRFWVIENPMGKMRRMACLAPFYRREVTYCRYGAPWMKPTDLWGGFPPELALRPPCSAGASCHIAAPRGSATGVQSPASIKEPRVRAWLDSMGGGSDMAALRSKIPPELALDWIVAAERSMESKEELPLGQLRVG